MKLMLNGKEVSGMGHYVMAGDIKDATAEDSNVLSGKTYYNNNGKREGTMPNRGGMSAELAAGGSVSIPEGYHNGEGVVRAQDLASQTQGTAAAGDIASGKTAWVNGALLTGSLAKGKKVATGQKAGSSGDLSITGLDFRPEGAIAVIGEELSNIDYFVVHGAFYYNGKGICAGSWHSTTPTTSNDSISASISSGSITLRTTGDMGFSKYYDYFYVVWGE